MNREWVKAALRRVGLFSPAQRLYWALKGQVVPGMPQAKPQTETLQNPGETQQPSAPSNTVTDEYAAKLAQEHATFAGQVDVHALPEIFHYWSNKYLLPKCIEFGFRHPDDHFANHLQTCLNASGPSRFVSIGAGNCDTEVRVAQLLRERGAHDFVIECLELNPHMLARGRELAEATGVAANIRTVECDFNRWNPEGSYDAVMANQSLHHVVELEKLFDAINQSLRAEGKFVISDTIGRNGHQRWPEAAELVREFWRELPKNYRYNLQLKRQEEEFMDWDCSAYGFEGIRAQDILPLLVERFHFHAFLPFANVIDPFIDRGFGHHFNPQQEWDRAFIDRVHARDEAAILDGSIKPAHLFACVAKTPHANPHYWAGLTPRSCVRAA